MRGLKLPKGFLSLLTTMAAKVSVESAQHHYKRSVADMLVRRLEAEWVEYGKRIRLLLGRKPDPNAPTRPAESSAPTSATYIPERLPSPEVPGLKWQPPTPKSFPGEQPRYFGLRYE